MGIGKFALFQVPFQAAFQVKALMAQSHFLGDPGKKSGTNLRARIGRMCFSRSRPKPQNIACACHKGKMVASILNEICVQRRKDVVAAKEKVHKSTFFLV